MEYIIAVAAYIVALVTGLSIGYSKGYYKGKIDACKDLDQMLWSNVDDWRSRRQIIDVIDGYTKKVDKEYNVKG